MCVGTNCNNAEKNNPLRWLEKLKDDMQNSFFSCNAAIKLVMSEL